MIHDLLTDADTVAVEVPVWMDEHELEPYARLLSVDLSATAPTASPARAR